MRPDLDTNGPPSPEHLAGYVDGELAAADVERVEAWLAAHPEAAAEVQAQRRLARQWAATAPPAPAEEAWTPVRARVEAAVAVRRRHRVRFAVLGTAAAAAVLFALYLARPRLVTTEAEEPYPVATTDDVDIISLDAADAAVLPVGRSPVSDAIELADANDVVITSVEPDEDGVVAEVHLPPDGSEEAPMVVAPLEQ